MSAPIPRRDPPAGRRQPTHRQPRRAPPHGATETLHSLERQPNRQPLLVVLAIDAVGQLLEAAAWDPEDYE